MKTYLEWEAEELFDESLRQKWGETTTVCGIEYDTSRLFRDTDPTRYRCDFLDWLDSMGAQEGSDQYNNITYTF